MADWLKNHWKEGALGVLLAAALGHEAYNYATKPKPSPQVPPVGQTQTPVDRSKTLDDVARAEQSIQNSATNNMVYGDVNKDGKLDYFRVVPRAGGYDLVLQLSHPEGGLCSFVLGHTTEKPYAIWLKEGSQLRLADEGVTPIAGPPIERVQWDEMTPKEKIDYIVKALDVDKGVELGLYGIPDKDPTAKPTEDDKWEEVRHPEVIAVGYVAAGDLPNHMGGKTTSIFAKSFHPTYDRNGNPFLEWSPATGFAEIGVSEAGPAEQNYDKVQRPQLRFNAGKK
jgi:hypothetical protein